MKPYIETYIDNAKTMVWKIWNHVFLCVLLFGVELLTRIVYFKINCICKTWNTQKCYGKHVFSISYNTVVFNFKYYVYFIYLFIWNKSLGNLSLAVNGLPLKLYCTRMGDLE